MVVAYPQIKIFGERSTSTNALKLLIERNSSTKVVPSVAEDIDPYFRIKMALMKRLPKGEFLQERYIDSVFRRAPIRYAWKHTATTFESVEGFSDCLILFNIRHPASWLLALHRRPHHALRAVPKSFEDFLATPWKTLQRERLGGEDFTPVEIYNKKIQSYLQFARLLDAKSLGHSFQRFEDFAIDQISVFEQLKQNLMSASESPQIIRSSTKDKSKDVEYYREYYGEEKWRRELSRDAASSINEAIDWPALARFDYRPL